MAGLAVVGGYTFHREAGDAFSLYFDEHTARDIMAHEVEGWSTLMWYQYACRRLQTRQDTDENSDGDKNTLKRKAIIPEKEKLEALDGNTEWTEANTALDSQLQQERDGLARTNTSPFPKAHDHEDTIGTFPGTTAQCNAALKKSLQVSKFLQPIIQGVETATTIDDSSPANPSSSSDPDPKTNDIDFDFGKFAQPEYTQNIFKLMHTMDKECPATSMLAEDVNVDNFTPASKDINKENECNEVPVSVAEVWEAMMILLMELMETDREVEKHYDKATKTWSCPKCPFYHHRPALQGVKFDSIVNFKQHMQKVHTKWKDLELKMVSHWGKDDDVCYWEYMCPCGYFSHRDKYVLQAHMITNNCPRKDHHESLL
ncbi:hypothetical protein EDD18DRAFT_1100521 [Armillaria luteobubalina]|uniref:Uncharacterized protein n=1 Tax=Armillaria luteobubalina TaxID=153913 RepID=A0AA39QH94_9AGAR|nr:hypothetical protein EDD18DRAFT_1100521 [Armillaria luteobubalina]